MRGAICFLALFVVALAQPAAPDAREDYVLLTAHVDSSMVRKRTAEGRVLEFVDVLGRKNRCAYDDDGRIHEIRYSTESGDSRLRFMHNKRGELTSMKLADGTIVLFRGGRMMPSTGKASLAESYAAALEHWLAKNNAGL
jgi:YD repeat-containing protein